MTRDGYMVAETTVTPRPFRICASVPGCGCISRVWCMARAFREPSEGRPRCFRPTNDAMTNGRDRRRWLRVVEPRPAPLEREALAQLVDENGDARVTLRRA